MEVSPVVALDLDKTEHYFGKHQKLISTLFFLSFNAIFYLPIIIYVYAIFTLNY